MREPLFSEIGLFAEGDLSNMIIEGEEIILPVLNDIKCEHIDSIKTLMKNFTRPEKDGVKVNDMNWVYGASEYRKTFSKISETKTVGPSGITMHHWKAITYDDELCELFAAFIEIPFRYGVTLNRWRNVTHIMLPKKSKPYLNKLRNIQITEGDYNGALKFLIGKKLRQYGDENNASSDHTYGGRNRRNCHQMLKSVQLKNEFSRIRFEPQAYLDVDAVGCFDNIATNIIGLAIRRAGGSKQLARTQIKALVEQQHRVKTALGLSRDYFQWDRYCKLGGSGQGSGASMFNWHSVNETLIKTYMDIMLKKIDKEEVSLTVQSFVDDNKLMFAFKGDTPMLNIYNIIKSGLLVWNKLLRLTGGELSIEKCFFSVISYSFDYYGNARQKLPIDDNMGINVDIHDRNYDIAQVRPDKGNRLLGVRLSGTGNFDDEYYFRLEQSSEMAVKMRKAKLSRSEAYLVYTTRYKPALHYPLYITTFTKSQCKKIQSPFINVLLPQLGLNRKMPRAVCFGPKLYGGLSLTNMEYDQVTKHLIMMRKHIIQDDHIGKQYIRTIRQYQNFIGCGEIFFNKDPNRYKYRPCSKYNSITYIWEKSWEYGIRINISNFEPSNTRMENDIAIMDAVLKRQEQLAGTDTCISENHIRMTNICRISNCVTWVSELRNGDGKVKNEIYRSYNSDRHDTTYPYIPECSKYIKEIFRQVICCSILIGDLRVNEGLFEYVRPSSEHLLFPETITGSNLNDNCEDILPYIKQLIGVINTETSTEIDLIDLLRNGQKIEAWSDGSLIDGKIGHGFLIRSCDRNCNAKIFGKGISLRGSFYSSLRPEHCGIISVLLIIWIWENRMRPNTSCGLVTIYVDNSTALNRLNGTRNFDCESTDSDLWDLSLKLVNNCKTKFLFKHVKAHQDQVIGPMTWEQSNNEVVDKLAKEGTNLVPTDINHPFPTMNFDINIDGIKLTANFASELHEHMAGSEMRKYIQSKFCWDDNVFFSIDWESFGEYFRGLNINKIANIIKYVYEWQYTKSWEKKIKHANNTRNEVTCEGINDDEEEIELCPAGCGRQEKNGHYLSCIVINKGRVPRTLRSSLLSWMRKSRTDPNLILVINRAMGSLTREVTIRVETRTWNDCEITELINEQNKIGWDHFLKGRLSRRFNEIQERYYKKIRDDVLGSERRLSPKYKGRWWTKELIKRLIFYSLNIWQIRNEIAHTDDDINQKRKENELSSRRIIEWYDKMKQYEKEMKYLFKIPVMERCMKNYDVNKAWLRTVELEYSRLSGTTSD